MAIKWPSLKCGRIARIWQDCKENARINKKLYENLNNNLKCWKRHRMMWVNWQKLLFLATLGH